MIKLSREETSFVTEEGIASFPHLYAGEAQSNDTNGNMAYKVEWIGDLTSQSQIVKTVSLVAQTYGGGNWQAFVAGAAGRLKKLEEMPKRDPSKYPYAVGKYVLGFTKTISPGFLGMKKPDLTNPATRARFDAGVLENAPGVVKFANPNNPADLYKLEQINQTKIIKGLPIIKEADYYQTRIPVEREEFWPGCYIRIAGYAFWSENTPLGKTVLLGLSAVLMTRQGERLVGGSNPDEAFDAFAPTADMAPGVQSVGHLLGQQSLPPIGSSAPNPWAKLL